MSRDAAHLMHISDSISRIARYVAVGHDRFTTETHWQDAVIRQLEIVGEATQRLSPDLRDRHHEVPCRRIADLRDVLIHDDMGVDVEAVQESRSRRASPPHA